LINAQLAAIRPGKRTTLSWVMAVIERHGETWTKE
jgi:hypothetical protein